MCAATAIDLIDNTNDIRNFTEHEIERITSGYTTLIGKGGFGEVYIGVLDNDDIVAVKRYIRGDLIQEFMEEVRIHSQIDHKNIVKLIGYCRGENTLIIVTEYISNGNLEDTLHNSDDSIPFDMRLGIAIGCARALSYMHSMHLPNGSLVCHGDIKPANFLLSGNLMAKVSDFGLSRILSRGITRYTTNVKGSIDYMDPIHLQKGCVTPRSDVYSFGIVLLELITRKRVKTRSISLIEIFTTAFAKGKDFSELFDAGIVSQSNIKILEDIAKLATKCLNLDVKKRPTMNDVTERLLVHRKALRGGDGNIGHRLFWRTQNEVEARHQESTNSFDHTNSITHDSGISKRNIGHANSVNSERTEEWWIQERISSVCYTSSVLCNFGISKRYVGLRNMDNSKILAKRWSHERNSSVSPTNSIMCPFGISKRNVGLANANKSEILAKLGNVRIFTKRELIEITENYSYLLGKGICSNFYKGTLDDNMLVLVEKYNDKANIEEFCNAVVILSEIVHKNIIKVFGYCFEDDIPFLVYEYSTNGNLYEILHGGQDFPLDLRFKIAIKTAEALEHLHTSSTGVIRHGSVMPSHILLDDNFMPKLAGFSFARRLTGHNKWTKSVKRHTSYTDPFFLNTGIVTVESDMYSFGILLLELITRKEHKCDNHLLCGRTHYCGLSLQFKRAYQKKGTTKAMLDKGITAEEDVAVLDTIGKLGLLCCNLDHAERLQSAGVAKRLEKLRRSWRSVRQRRRGPQVKDAMATGVVGIEEQRH